MRFFCVKSLLETTPMQNFEDKNLESLSGKISLLKLLAACVYELLILIAIWMFSAWVFIAIFGDASLGVKRLLLQFVLWMIAGAYFIWCWIKSGQTLATQAWNIKLVNNQNKTLSLKQAFGRYVLASVSLLLVGLGFFWAVVDNDNYFLHDRLLKTRFIKTN